MENPALSAANASPLQLLKGQRSHVLLMLSNPDDAAAPDYAHWYANELTSALRALPKVTRVRSFREDDVDVTSGRHVRLPYEYLAICELSLDGAEEAAEIMDAAARLFASARVAAPPAMWLYYPVSEAVGRGTRDAPAVTIAYANAKTGFEAGFREFYVTRHIRHALHIPALVSGQCFERAQIQKVGSMPPSFELMAIYEQTGTAQSIVDAFRSLPPGTIAFPALDTSKGRFAEASYRRLS